MLALHAFGLEESARYAEAEAAGRRALAGDGARAVGDPRRRPRDGDAGAPRGRRALDGRVAPRLGRTRRRRQRRRANGFAGHLGWHEALFALEGLDTADARCASSTTTSTPARIEITLQRVDAASLLWRLRLLGADVGDRWQQLVAGWPLDAAAAGRSVFNDAHATMALIGAGETARAREWVALCSDEAERRGRLERATVSRDVGAPLMHGLLAFGAGRYADAAAAIAPLRERLARIGGSHAQRDVVEQTLLAAAAHGADATPAGRCSRRERAPSRRRRSANGGRARSPEARGAGRAGSRVAVVQLDGHRRVAGAGGEERRHVQTNGADSFSVANARCTAGRASMRSSHGSMCGSSRAGRAKPRVQRQSTKA